MLHYSIKIRTSLQQYTGNNNTPKRYRGKYIEVKRYRGKKRETPYKGKKVIL